MTRVQEVELDHAFAEALEGSLEFQSFVLAGGRFARYAGVARLLRDEQALARKSAKHWWKHWWTKMPDGTESETDIFAVFEAGSDRFALHIENKPTDGKLLIKQAADYRRRATYRANDPKWLNYTDFETILLAPSDFITRNSDCLAQFDRAIAYEDVQQFAPCLHMHCRRLFKGSRRHRRAPVVVFSYTTA